MAVIGSGYIAVEIAGVLQALGTDTTLISRKDLVLRGFDDMVRETLTDAMIESGIHKEYHFKVKKLIKADDGTLIIESEDGQHLEGFDEVIWAVGRQTLTEPLALDKVGLEVNGRGFIDVNDYHQTDVPNIYAIGDVTGQAQLTPVAIRAGRYLAERLYNNQPQLKMDLSKVPTVVFRIRRSEPLGWPNMMRAVNTVTTMFRSIHRCLHRCVMPLPVIRSKRL